jgi:hypothetical protein
MEKNFHRRSHICNVLSNSNCHFEDGEELPLKNYSCNALSNTKRRLEDGEEVPLLKKSCNVSDTHEGEGPVLEGFPDIFLVQLITNQMTSSTRGISQTQVHLFTNLVVTSQLTVLFAALGLIMDQSPH